MLVCNVSRDVMVTWSRDNGRPFPNTPDGNMLRIEMPQAEDGGVYRCSAEGVVAMFNLVVMELPPSSEEPVYDVIMTAHSVYICEAYIMPFQVDFLFPIAQKVLVRTYGSFITER